MPDGLQAIGSPAIEAVLASRGLLSGAALERARRLAAESGERIDRIAAKLGLVSERHLAAAYSELIGSPVLIPTDFPSEAVAIERIGVAFLKHARVIPLAESEAALVLAMADPLDRQTARALEFALDKPVHPRVAVPADIEAAFERLYGEGRSAIDRIYEAAGDREDEDRDADLERLKDLASEAPVIRLVDALTAATGPPARPARFRHNRSYIYEKQQGPPAASTRLQPGARSSGAHGVASPALSRSPTTAVAYLP